MLLIVAREEAESHMRAANQGPGGVASHWSMLAGLVNSCKAMRVGYESTNELMLFACGCTKSVSVHESVEMGIRRLRSRRHWSNRS